MKKSVLAILLASTIICGNKAFAQQDVVVGGVASTDGEVADIFDLSLEELADIEITSFSKRSEKASEVAAAVHVLTEDDIRRSAATTIPELLRQVPGLQVARAGAHDWAITARGFNAQFANKLLVLIDGRTVYTPLFSGVFWDIQDTLLEDIARVEVIRGPGGTIWGANAVNGVINIITKQARDSQGSLARVTMGNYERNGAVRQGVAVGDDGYFKIYAQYKNNNEFRLADSSGADDEWRQWNGGFRFDKELEKDGNITIQGGAYSGYESSDLLIPSLTSANFTDSYADQFRVFGAHLVSKWELAKDGNEYSLQGYYDLAARKTFVFEHRSHTFDIDFNHSLPTNGVSEWMWGVGYRLIYTDINSTPILNFMPEERTDNLFTAFVQNKISLIENELSLTVGSKFEHNDYTGFEWQPSARLAWIINENNTFWAAITRAVRTANRATHTLDVVAAAVPTSTGGAIIRQVGDKGTGSETVISYETGYRIQPSDNTSLDVSLFFNDYKTLLADMAEAPQLITDGYYGTHISIPYVVNNDASGETYGFELSANWQVNENWLLSGSFSYIDMNLNGGSTFVSSEDNTPQHQFNISSRYSFDNGIEWDNHLYYVNELGSGSSIVPEYWRYDTRVSWPLAEGIEVSVVGQNLLDDHHPEFGPFLYQSQVEVPRAVYGKISWEF